MKAAVVDVHESSAARAELVRLHMPRAAYAGLLEGRLGELHRRYPLIQINAAVDDALIYIVRAGFDLDVRLSGAVDASTSALAIGGPVRHVAVTSPAYLAEHGTPATPSDLARHRCIQWRRPGTEHPYRWAFQIEGCTTLVDVEGPLTVSHCDLAVVAAIELVGIAFVLEQHAAEALACETLKPVLTQFLPPFPGWSLRHPRTSRLAAAGHSVTRFLSELLHSCRRRTQRRAAESDTCNGKWSPHAPRMTRTCSGHPPQVCRSNHRSWLPAQTRTANIT